MFRRACCVLFVTLSCAAAHAADVGGWMEQKSRAELQQGDDCPEIIALASRHAQADAAARTPDEAAIAASSYYASGMCYLASDKVARDAVAASAWLTRAAELDHPLARRALLSLRAASTTSPSHPAGYHCHDLGLGRKLCHGGAVMQ